jgi:quinoprotein glucose dehydrogenase
MRILSFLILAITGLAMALPGFYLATLGGSLYYAIAGVLILGSAWLVLQRRRFGVMLFWLVFAGTILWALWEVGLDGWALMPRLVYLAVAACALLLLDFAPLRRPAALLLALIFAAVAGAVFFTSRDNVAQAGAPGAVPAVSAADGEWTHYGNSQHGTRYSRLAQITPANAANLEEAWTYHVGLNGRDKHSAHQLEVTPIKVDGLLYGCSPHTAIYALDPATGRQVWRHETRIDMSAGGRGVCRGVSFFRAPANVSECPTRLLVGTVDNKLIAVDAKTGESCRGFGKDGAVDLSEGEGLEPATRGWINPTSPPAIVHGTAVIGSFVVDNFSTRVPPGVIRGYDAVTGQLKWAFDPGKPDDHNPLPPGATYTPSTPNAWPPFSGDEALGLVYVPMGNGSPDYYGPHRTPQTDRFTAAVVALDADTGAVRWVFQAVHHDLWDYDLAAQPVLVDFPLPGGKVPALIQATKTGQIFVLDRRSGKPLTKVEEKPVPPSTIPGERASPTQPYSTGMPDFAGPALAETDMWGMTPFDQLYCRIKFRQATYHGMYTPLRFGSSVRTPGELGGIDWGSVAVDEGRGIMVVNSNLMADWDELISREQADSEHLFTSRDPRSTDAPRPPHRGAAMEGTPYGLHFDGFLTPLGIPCQRPPYGYLAAVDLKSQKLLWQHPLGNASNSGPFGMALGLPFRLGTPNIGGSVVTAGGVIFIAATQDKYFRAIDEKTGRILWERKLPAGGHATPITYLGADGRQYVLIAAGGSGGFGTGSSDSLIAYRLKR